MIRPVMLLAIALCFSLFVAACSTMMPYADEPLCRKSVSGGYCGSLSDVYDATVRDSDAKAQKNAQGNRQPLK